MACPRAVDRGTYQAQAVFLLSLDMNKSPPDLVAERDTAQIEQQHVAQPVERENHQTFFAWVVVCAASSVLFVGVGYTNTFGVFEEYYETRVFPSVPPEKTIVIGSIASSLYFVFGALTGRFADIVGYRASLLIGSGLMVGSMFAASASTEYWHFLLSQGIMFGVGLAFVYMPATTVSRQYFGKDMHGVANGVVVSGGALGGCILPYSVQRMLESYGLPQTFRILGYLAIGILVPSIVLLKPKQQSLNSGKAGRPPLMDFALLQNPRFIGLLVSCTIAMTGFLPRYFLLPTSAKTHGISSAYSSWLLGLMNGLSIIGRVGIGYFADHYGQVTALSASFLLCGIGHIIFWLPGLSILAENSAATTALFTLFVVFIGIFGSGFISLFPVVVSHLFGSEALASKTGLLNSAIGISTLAGPSLIYAIIGDGNRIRWVLGILVSGLFMCIGGLVLVAVTIHMKRKDYRTTNGTAQLNEP